MSEGRWRLVEPYPRFDIMDKRRSNDGKKNGIILKESSASQRKRINGEVLTLHQASRSPILSISKWYRAWIRCEPEKILSRSRYGLYISLHLKMLVRIMTYFNKLISLYYYSTKVENGTTRPRPLHKYPDIN